MPRRDRCSHIREHLSLLEIHSVGLSALGMTSLGGMVFRHRRCITTGQGQGCTASRTRGE